MLNLCWPLGTSNEPLNPAELQECLRLPVTVKPCKDKDSIEFVPTTKNEDEFKDTLKMCPEHIQNMYKDFGEKFPMDDKMPPQAHFTMFIYYASNMVQMYQHFNSYIDEKERAGKQEKDKWHGMNAKAMLRESEKLKSLEKDWLRRMRFAAEVHKKIEESYDEADVAKWCSDKERPSPSPLPLFPCSLQINPRVIDRTDVWLITRWF